MKDRRSKGRLAQNVAYTRCGTCTSDIACCLIETRPICDLHIEADRKDQRGDKASADGSFGSIGEVLACHGEVRNKGGNIDQTGERVRVMGRLEVDRGDLKRHLTNECLEEQLRDLDVGDERNGEVDGHTTGTVTLAGIARRAPIVVLRWQVDVHVDEVVREMLREGILRLLIAVLAKDFEVLDGRSEWSTSPTYWLIPLTLHGMLCSVKKSAVPDVPKML